MKYIIIDDLLYFKKKLPFIIIVYITWILILVFNLNYENYYSVMSFLGITYYYNYSLTLLLYYIFNISVFVLLCQDLFNKDLRYNIDILFTRIDKKKWIAIKMISIFIITFIMKFILYFITFFFNKEILGSFIYDIFNTLIIQSIALLLLSSRIKYYYGLLLLIIFIAFKTILDNSIYINIYFLVIISIATFILNIVNAKYNLTHSFERSNM